MKTFNFILTKFLRIALIFWLVFIWARFYIQNLAWAILATCTITLIFEFFISYLLKKKDIKSSLESNEIKQADGFANYFIFNPKNIAVIFFYQTFSKKYSVVKKAEYIMFENGTKKTILYPKFKVDKLTLDDVVAIFNKIKALPLDNLIICTNLTDTSLTNFLKNLPIQITILDKYAVYEQIFKKFENYPEESYNVKDKKKNIRMLLEYSLNRSKAKGYVFASVILLISSLFVKMTIYYLIMSSILLLLAIFSYSNSIFNKKINFEELF